MRQTPVPIRRTLMTVLSADQRGRHADHVASHSGPTTF